MGSKTPELGSAFLASHVFCIPYPPAIRFVRSARVPRGEALVLPGDAHGLQQLPGQARVPEQEQDLRQGHAGMGVRTQRFYI